MDGNGAVFVVLDGGATLVDKGPVGSGRVEGRDTSSSGSIRYRAFYALYSQIGSALGGT